MKILLVAACAAAAATHPDPRLLETARAQYYEAAGGNNGALTEAAKLFSQLRTGFPEDPLVLAYAGSTQLLEAKRTFAPWRKGKLAQQGLAALDDAVARAPENLEVRFVRAASTFHLPDFFHRRSQSRSDFEWLAARVAAAVTAGTLERRFGASALYHHGLFREQSGDPAGARAAWQEAIRIGGDSNAASEARKRLAQSP